LVIFENRRSPHPIKRRLFSPPYSFKAGRPPPPRCAPSTHCATMNEAGPLKRPKSAPTGLVRERSARYVMPGGAIDRRCYEYCVLSEVCGRLRAGDRAAPRRPRGGHRQRSRYRRCRGSEREQNRGAAESRAGAAFGRYRTGACGAEEEEAWRAAAGVQVLDHSASQSARDWDRN